VRISERKHVKILYDVSRFEAALKAAVKAGFEVESFDSDDIAYLEINTIGDDVAVHVRPASRLTRYVSKRATDDAEDYFVPQDFGQHCGVDVY
jgi:hypothetical protein